MEYTAQATPAEPLPLNPSTPPHADRQEFFLSTMQRAPVPKNGTNCAKWTSSWELGWADNPTREKLHIMKP